MSSKIEWTNETWNPVTGCSKVSEGCRNCYAEREWPRLAGNPKTVYHGRKFTDVEFHAERLNQPLRWKKPRMIFVNSMSDLFHEDVPDDSIWDVMSTMKKAPQHTFQVLTKRPERMSHFLFKYVPLPNVWWGVSVEDQKTADERIPLLLETPAAVRFVSYEPALGPVDFQPFLCHDKNRPSTSASHDGEMVFADWIWHLDWVIAGGESGPNARPSHPDWFRSVRDQCQAAGVPFFFKQWGEWAPWHTVTIPEGMDWCVAETSKRVHISPNGKTHGNPHLSDEWTMYRVGKKRAGRILDGRTWGEMPEGGQPCN